MRHSADGPGILLQPAQGELECGVFSAVIFATEWLYMRDTAFLSEDYGTGTTVMQFLEEVEGRPLLCLPPTLTVTPYCCCSDPVRLDISMRSGGGVLAMLFAQCDSSRWQVIEAGLQNVQDSFAGS